MEFEEYKLEEVSINYNQKRIPLSGAVRSKMKDRKYPYYGAQGVIDFVEDYIFDGMYLLIAEDGENLKSRKQDVALIAEDKFWVNNHAHILQENELSNIYVLKELINRMNLEGYITGSAQPKLNKGNLNQIRLKLPSKENQDRIGNIILAFDEKTQLNNRIINNLEQLAQTLFKRWFVDFEFPNENGNPYKSNGGEMVESELGMIPKGWEIKTLEKVSVRPIVCGKTPSTKRIEYYGEELPFITIPDMHDKVFAIESARSLSKKGAESQPSKTIPPLSICVSCIATPGLVVLTSQNSQTNQQINSLIPLKEDAYYLFLTLRNKTEYIRELGSGGSTTLNLNKTQFSKIPIIYPNNLVRKSFHTIIKNQFDLILNLQRENKKLINLRDTLLPKLLSGEIELPEETEVTEDVPIS